jgi:DNA-binding beta-propeller fold protein YncE
MPRHIAVSPDGQLLAVAVEGGAAYNLLSIHQNGSIGTVTASLRPRLDAYLPTTPHPSVPSTVFFDQNNAFLAADMGGRISSLSIDEDLALKINKHRDFAQGGTSLQIVAYPTAERYFIADSRDSTIFVVSRSLHVLQELKLSLNKGVSALAINPSGSALFAATCAGISVVSIDNSGVLRVSADFEQMPGDIDVLECSRDGLHLFATTRSRSIIRMQIAPRSNALSSPLSMVFTPSPTAIAFQYR